MQILIKLLTVIRELLNYSSETTEHNMKLIINSLRDYAINNDNLEVSEICLSILVNLCLKNDAAKYLITQIMKQTALKDKIKKISDNLVAFKYFILIEDEIFSNDVKYFLRMCLTDVKTSVSTFNSESINHSLDVLFHVEKAEIRLDFRISDEEDLVSMLSQLNSELIENISEDISPKKQVFYSGIFHLYNVILQLDPTLVATFENFTESIFLSTVSKSANALKFLSTFIGFDGNLASSEIVVEGLVEFFAGNPVEDDENINFTQKIAFLGLLEPLQAKEKLSDVHLNTIGDYFCHIVDTFKSAKLSSLEDEDAFFFIYFVFALSSVAKKNLVFYGRLLEVLKLDFVPMMMAKGHVSKNKEILDILFKLAAVENFPNRKISSILSRCSINSEIVEEKSTTNTKRSSDCATKFVAGQLAEEIEQLIKRINQKINSGDINNVAITDLMQLFRLKNDICNDQLTSVNEALDLSTFENGRLKQKIGTLNLLTSKQDFITWCHQLDKERLAGEGKDLTQIIKSLKNSIDAFQKKLEKKEASIHQTEKALRLKTKEIQGELEIRTKSLKNDLIFVF